MKYLFIEEELIEESYYKELLLAKELRIDTQYYINEDLDKEKLKKDSQTASNFVLKMEQVIESLVEEKIIIIRDKLDDINPLKKV